MDGISERIKSVRTELEAHAKSLEHQGTSISATPKSIAGFATLLTLLAEQADATAEKNLRIAKMGISIAWITLAVSVVAAVLTFAQLILALCQHSK